MTKARATERGREGWKVELGCVGDDALIAVEFKKSIDLGGDRK